MSKKSRAQQDAERLAALEADQAAIDSGEASIEEIDQKLADQDDPPSERQPQPYDEQPEPKKEVKSSEDIEELKHQIANMKRTLSFYEQELNPAQKRAQQLEREVEELRAQVKAQPQVPEGPTDYGFTEEESEFETVRSISEKVSKAQNAKILKELESLKLTLKSYEDAKSEMSLNAKIDTHRKELSKALGGDSPDDLFAHPKIDAWMANQSEEEILALRNPIMYSPKFVAGVLTRFKAEALKGQVARKPSHGESAVPDRVAPDTIARSNGSSGSEPTFDARTFQSDIQKLIASGRTGDAEKLIKVAERAMSA